MLFITAKKNYNALGPGIPVTRAGKSISNSLRYGLFFPSHTSKDIYFKISYTLN